jgi:hypothetical protein
MQNDQKDRNLHRLPPHIVPAELSAKLRVTASRESLYRRRRVTIEAFCSYLVGEAGLLLNNMVRPFAVPVAGGVLAALMTFSAAVHAYPRVNRVYPTDVPTGLTTEAVFLASIPIALETFSMTDDMVIDVTVDETGRISDYSIPAGQSWANDAKAVRNVEHFLVVTQFTPATFFGRPANGKARITLRSSGVNVRG